jgi:NitT/TauT family transport system substrate-binding protein
MMKALRIICQALALVCAAALGTTLAASEAVAQTKLKLLEGSPPTVAMVDFFVARDAGFFREEGLQVDIEYAANGSVGTQATANNQADVGDVTFEPFLIGHDKGMRGKIVFSRFDLNVYYIAVPKDSLIQTMKDLAGKKIGVLGMGSSSVYYVRSMARAAGLDPQADMFLPVGQGDAAIAALKINQIQALALNTISYAGLVRAGNEFRYLKHPTLGSTGNYGLFSSDAALKDKRDDITKFIRAMVKARIFIRANPQAAVQIYWKTIPGAKPAGDTDTAMKQGVSELNAMVGFDQDFKVEKYGDVETAGIDRLVGVLRQENIMTTDLKGTDVADMSLLARARTGIDVAIITQAARNWK